MTKEKGKQMGKNTVKKIIACMVLVFVMCGYGMLDGYAADTSECTTYGGSILVIRIITPGQIP